MGTVYRATDTALGRTVAIKVLPRSLVRSARVVERFLFEARGLSALDHPNVVPVYDVGRDEDHLFFVMKVLEGRVLADEPQPMRSLDALRAVDHVLAGLAHIHEKGLVHRDIKPENLFVETSGRVVILDFGILRAISEDDRSTGSGFVVGTPGYIAPEVLLGDPGDARSDLFGVAVVLHEILTGQLPFPVPMPGKPLLPHTRAALRLRRFLPSVHPSLEAFVAKGLALDPELRFASAAEMRAAAAAVVERIGDHSRRVDSRPTSDVIVVRRRSRAFAILGAVAASAVLAAGGLWLVPPEIRSHMLQAEAALSEVPTLQFAKPSPQAPVADVLRQHPTENSRPVPRRRVPPRTPGSRRPASVASIAASGPPSTSTRGLGADRCVLPGADAALPGFTTEAELHEERLRELIKESAR